jgi:trans-2,3-dihydro-3-hydroxyanthranilate isomerase
VPEPPWLPYEVVDVFTDRAFAGNPLAVVLGADGLPTAALQALAQEFALSETAFPLPPDRDGADYRLRIFTPVTELPFAGHPSVGAAEVMARTGRVGAGRVVQSCGAGLLPLVVDGSDVTLTAGEPSVGGPVDPGPLLAALGLSPDDVAGPAGRAGCGLEFTYLLVRDDAVARALPDAGALRALDLGAGVSVTSWADGRAHSRVFVPEVGVAEDPATGSAAVGLAVHLAAAGLLRDGAVEYVVHQGREMGRPSVLRCAARVAGGSATEVTVAGHVVPVARGEVRVPRS